ncbi:MAG: LacI family DNA-binding transcriptional regulator [Bacteroidetes bacterium]|nr:LacI family DNA-binding transcriptional regulator [Bacteroidota bacterium]
MRKKSIHDIAKELKVSAATISFVLNGKAEEKRISETVRQRVLDYVKQVGYGPSLVAQSLRTGKTKIIGMLVEDISDSFFAAIARTAELAAAGKGYKILLSSTENDTENTKGLLRWMRESHAEGYIIAPPPGIGTELQEMLHEKTPIVLFDRFFPGIPTHNIVIDNYQGAVLAIEHFIDNGFRHIGFVTLDSDQTQMSARMKGYLDVIGNRSLTPCILKLPYNLGEGKSMETISGFLKKHPSLEAILFATNYLTIAGIGAMRQMQLSIPSGIAVVGFDDNPHFPLLSPAISAVAQPVREIAEHSINKLLAILSGKEPHTANDNIVLPVSLQIRQSSSAVNAMNPYNNQQYK